MLVDTFLPEYQFSERHDILINSSCPQVYERLHRLDLHDAIVIRWLFRLRGLPSSGLTLEGLRKIGFAVLGEIPDQEVVLGLVGRFWTIRGDLQKIDSDTFKAFDRPGFAKAVWNFRVHPQLDGGTRLVTETRILCLDAKSTRRFRWYWLMIGTFSGVIRKQILRVLKKQAEVEWKIEEEDG